jgi:hypothetical protein
MNSDSLLSSFGRADDFLAGAKQLTNLDYAASTTIEQDRRENSVLNELTAMVNRSRRALH